MDNDQKAQALAAEYQAALVEERLLWKQLDDPQMDVTERVKASARWSAAAERARALSVRINDTETSAQHQ